MEEINLFLLRPPQQEGLPEEQEGPQEDLPEEQEGKLLKWRQSILLDTEHCRRPG